MINKIKIKFSIKTSVLLDLRGFTVLKLYPTIIAHLVFNIREERCLTSKESGEF